MDLLARSPRSTRHAPPWEPPATPGDDAADIKPACAGHEFVTHDQRAGDACELEFDDLDPRERSIFLRCGFRAPWRRDAA